MGNLLTNDFTADRIFLHQGFSSTVTNSFSSPSDNPRGLCYDSTNIISSDTTTDYIYLHQGFSSTITNSFSSLSTAPTGVTWDGSNLISLDASLAKVYLHSGFTTTITNSYSTIDVSPSGVTWDGSNTIDIDTLVPSRIFLHNGFSNTITNSFSTPGSIPPGVSWDGINIYSSDSGTNYFYLHTGFSSTITDSFWIGLNPSGVEWDERLATNKFAIFLFKDRLGAVTHATITWNGRTNLAPTVSTVYLQAYNRTTLTWITIDSDNLTAADTDFNLEGNLPTGGALMSDFLDADNFIAHRVYQQKL